MEFLTLLIVLGLLQWWGSGGLFQRDDWFDRWQQYIQGTLSAERLRLLTVVVAPSLLIVLLQMLVSSLLFGLLSLILYVSVLLFSLGRGHFSACLQEYLHAWNHGDFEAAYEKATAIGDFRQSDAINDYSTLHDSVRKAVVYAGFERWFVVVFWFLLLGPAGALAYRLCFLYARSERSSHAGQQLALQIIHYLDWFPARLLAASFTLTGNFVHCFNHLWQVGLDNQPIPELLDDCGSAAISGLHDGNSRPADEESFIIYGRAQMQALQSLLSRSVVCWLMIIAVLQLT